MKIGLLGYGKMGKAIEPIAIQRGHEIVWKIGSANRSELDVSLIQTADCVIEFSRPESAEENIFACLHAGVPVVSGTTGWLEGLEKARKWTQQNDGGLLWASNFSIGVNILFAVNQYLAKLMNPLADYEPSVEETHHVHKLDAPSGTAVTLTQGLLNQLDRKTDWKLEPDPVGPEDIPVRAIREDEVPGTHIIQWTSEIDEIKLEHRAFSRTGFALGSVVAAEWLLGKKGCFSMQDVLDLPKQ